MFVYGNSASKQTGLIFRNWRIIKDLYLASLQIQCFQFSSFLNRAIASRGKACFNTIRVPWHPQEGWPKNILAMSKRDPVTFCILPSFEAPWFDFVQLY